jgi:hypothetical protein
MAAMFILILLVTKRSEVRSEVLTRRSEVRSEGGGCWQRGLDNLDIIPSQP